MDLAVFCRGDQSIAGALGRAPQSQLASSRLIVLANKRNGGVPVFNLVPWIDELTRCTAAVAEIAVVENKRGKSLPCEIPT